jgi:hypothetical protein
LSVTHHPHYCRSLIILVVYSYNSFKPNEDTYVALLQAYASAQSVGASTYSTFGRYSKPKPAPLTADEKAMVTVGPLKTFKMRE